MMERNITVVDHEELPSTLYIILAVATTSFTLVILFLNSMLWFYLKDAKTPSVIFIKAMLLLSTPAIFIGLPLQIATFTNTFNALSYMQCKHVNLTATVTIMSSSLMIQLQLSGMAMQRYCVVANKNYLFIKTSTKFWVVVLAAIGIFATVAILYDMVSVLMLRDLGKCAIKYNVRLSKCSNGKNCTHFITIGVITFIETLCNTFIYRATLHLKKYIKSHERNTSNVLGSTRVTNLDRLKATHYLWIAFSVIWIPWGLADISFLIFTDPRISIMLNDISHTICYTSFIAVSLVYIKMDKSFSTYMKTKIKFGKLKHKRVGIYPNAVMKLS